MSVPQNKVYEPNAPLGGDAVGKSIARDFGKKHGGIFFGVVKSVRGQKQLIYHVQYTDGDEEDFDEDQFVYAYFLARSKNPCGCEDNSDSDDSSAQEMHQVSRGKRVSEEVHASSKELLEPKWYNVGKGSGKRFKPVVSRTSMEAQERRPKFKPACKETGDISPGAFSRIFLADDVVEQIAKNSERYRKQCAVSFKCTFI